MSSWNQIKTDLLTFAKSHKQVSSFGTGDPLLIGTDNVVNLKTPDRDRIVYPLVFLTVEPSNIASRVLNLNVTLYVMDRVESDRNINAQDADSTDFMQDKEDEVISDTLQIAQDFIAYIIDNPDLDYQLNENVSVNPFFESRDDLVAGWSASLIFEIPYSRNVCQIPD